MTPLKFTENEACGLWSDKGLYLPGNGWFRWSFPRPGLFSGAKLFYKISLGISTTFRGHRCYLQICFPRQHSPFPITIFVQTRAVKLQGLYWFSPNPTIPGSSEIVCNKLVPTNHKKKQKKATPERQKSRWYTTWKVDGAPPIRLGLSQPPWQIATFWDWRG